MKVVLFGNRYLRDREEEVLNALTHALGLGLACGMSAALFWRGSQLSSLHAAAGLAYGIAHVIVYLASVAYHYAEHPPLKTRLRVLDQAAIYSAIAGTYTPVLALGIPSPWNVGLLILTWTACVVGIIYKVRHWDQPERGSLATYLSFALAGSLLFLIVGSGPIDESRRVFMASGVLDIAGLAFYVWHYKRFFHTAWHVLVMIGNLVHFYAVWHYFMV